MVAKVIKFSDMVMKCPKVKKSYNEAKKVQVSTEICGFPLCLQYEVQCEILVEFDPIGSAAI